VQGRAGQVSRHPHPLRQSGWQGLAGWRFRGDAGPAHPLLPYRRRLRHQRPRSDRLLARCETARAERVRHHLGRRRPRHRGRPQRPLLPDHRLRLAGSLRDGAKGRAGRLADHAGRKARQSGRTHDTQIHHPGERRRIQGLDEPPLRGGRSLLRQVLPPFLPPFFSFSLLSLSLLFFFFLSSFSLFLSLGIMYFVQTLVTLSTRYPQYFQVVYLICSL
jgi:hypothetical protein